MRARTTFVVVSKLGWVAAINAGGGGGHEQVRGVIKSDGKEVYDWGLAAHKKGSQR